ncbi:MAG: transposase [Deltaproteobacteria bacterium]|nr:transposase [Deltaproteobacteria bacterium]
MPRQARLDSPGTLHHVIIRGIERNKIVEDDKDRKNFVDRLEGLSVDLMTSVYAWALLTNHAHILLRSGQSGLSAFMRKLLTGYAISFNKRHKRHGHLFENRYKSIVCDEDTYFMELVRYIHLNPLRSGLVDTFATLDWYRWCGHSAVMGRRKNAWQDCDYVLAWFGSSKKAARRAYRQFVQKGVELGSQPHLVGGGLVRSLGGWSQVKALRRIGDGELFDDRILGSGEFVERVTQEVDLSKKYRFTPKERQEKAMATIEAACNASGISMEALRNGSRRREVSQVRAELAILLTVEYGLSFAEAARQLGITTSAVARIIDRRRELV